MEVAHTGWAAQPVATLALAPIAREGDNSVWPKRTHDELSSIW